MPLWKKQKKPDKPTFDSLIELLPALIMTTVMASMVSSFISPSIASLFNKLYGRKQRRMYPSAFEFNRSKEWLSIRQKRYSIRIKE